MSSGCKGTRKLALSGVSAVALLLSAGASFAQTSSAAAQSGDTATPSVQELTVTGSSIRGVPPTGSNLVSVTPEDIKEIGAQTTPDLLSNVPLLNSFNTAPTQGFGAFAPGLRGLPSTATLPLLNGHRLVGGSATDTNPNYPDVPSLALQRVEIVADGSSAIYGSDAIAGVVNFITKKHFTGEEASARYGWADNYHTYSGNALVGKDWDTGSVMLAYEYTQNSDLIAADRDYRILNFTPYGGLDARPTNCPTPNVRIPATGSTNYAYPGLVLGTTNFCDTAAAADLVPAVRVNSGFLSAQQDVGSHVTLWADVLYSDRTNKAKAAPPSETLTFTSANPFFQAPPGSGATSETVLFNLGNVLGANHTINTDVTKTTVASGGADVSLPHDLNLSVYGTYDVASNVAFIPGVNATLLGQAVAGTTTATALDPFSTRTSPFVAAGIMSAPTAVTIQQAVYLGAAKIDGPLFTLPGGQLKFAAGAEVRRETFKQRGVVATTPVPEDDNRDAESAYLEFFVPLVSEKNRAPGVYNLDLSLSGRYDHYSDFGSTTNPKIGLDWQPMEGLTLRGAYGTSFRAPGQRQLGATIGVAFVSSTAAAISAIDPTRTTQVNTLEIVGGNHSLKPETATTYSTGIEWQPTFLKNLRMSLNYFDIKFTNAIATPSVTQLFSDPTFAARVIRNPDSTQLASLLALGVPESLPNPLPAIGNVLDLRLGNFGIRDTNGVDLDTNYRQPMSFGSVFGSLSGTYYLKYDTQLSAASPVSNQLHLGTARYNLRGTVGITDGPVTASASINYGAGIVNNFNTPTGAKPFQAAGYTTLDLRVGWTLPNSGLTKGSELSLQVNDLFDERPPFFPAGSGAAGNFDPIGRLIAVNLQKTF